jgi:hypothetical protein
LGARLAFLKSFAAGFHSSPVQRRIDRKGLKSKNKKTGDFSTEANCQADRARLAGRIAASDTTSVFAQEVFGWAAAVPSAGA